MRGAQDAGGLPVIGPPPAWVYLVRECGVTLQFVSTEQVHEARDYFLSRPASTRRYNNGLEHYWHFWWERLPAGLVGSSKRRRMAAALERAVVAFGDDAPR
ncbi:hypothetical protein [Oerskovia turbata]